MMFDSHIHTKVSFDSEMQIEDAITAAEALGLGMVLTEHIDFDFPGGGYLFEPKDYFNQYAAYHSEKLLLGVEIGMQAAAADRNSQIVTGNDFDCVIGSIHLLDGVDLFEPAVYENRTKPDVYHEYFQVMEACLKQHGFIDILGHIDYIARYATYREPDIFYHEFTDSIRAVFQAALERDIILELNTRRLQDRSALKALVPLYKAYVDCGGRYATLGSDAHGESAIGKNFAVAQDLLSACGIKPVYFKKRKMQYI